MIMSSPNFIVAGSNGLQLMDKAVKEAEDGGIKLIMCLTKCGPLP